LVAATNVKAIKHVEKLGFRAKKIENRHLTKLFLGIDRWIYYEMVVNN
jgi:hypothetical protein